MHPITEALRAKYRTPQAALAQLGLDASLLREESPKPMSGKDKAWKAGLTAVLAQDEVSLTDIIEFIDALKATQAEGAAEEAEEAAEEAEENEAREDEHDEHKDDNPEATDEEEMAGMNKEPGSAIPAKKDGEMEEKVAHDSPAAKLHELLEGKLSEEEMARVGEILAEFADKPEGEEDGATDCAGKTAKDERDESGGGNADDGPKAVEGSEAEEAVTKPAMDAAIAAAVKDAETRARENARAIREAERAVRPYVGELAMDAASDEEIYRKALTMLGVDGADKVHASALPVLLKQIPLPGSAPKREPSMGMDSKSSEDFFALHPGAQRISA